MLVGNVVVTEQWERSGGRSVLVAWVPEGWWGMPSAPREHQRWADQLGKGQGYATEHEDVGHEAVGIVEGIPWLRRKQKNREKPRRDYVVTPEVTGGKGSVGGRR